MIYFTADTNLLSSVFLNNFSCDNWVINIEFCNICHRSSHVKNKSYVKDNLNICPIISLWNKQMCKIYNKILGKTNQFIWTKLHKKDNLKYREFAGNELPSSFDLLTFFCSSLSTIYYYCLLNFFDFFRSKKLLGEAVINTP